MIVALAVIALAVGAGAVIAVSAGDLHISVLGLAAVVVGSALLADPLPGPVILAVRIVAGLLVVVLMWAAADRAEAERGSGLGWPAEALIAIGAAFGGLGIAATVSGAAFAGVGVSPGALGLTGGLTPTALIAMAAAALIVLGAAPALLAGSTVRRTIGVVLVVQGVIALRMSLAGSAADLEQLVVAGLLVACAATGMAIATAERGGAEPGTAIDRADPARDVARR